MVYFKTHKYKYIQFNKADISKFIKNVEQSGNIYHPIQIPAALFETHNAKLARLYFVRAEYLSISIIYGCSKDINLIIPLN